MEYGEMVKALSKPGENIVNDLTPWKAELWHMATGVSGEAGELLDAVKKHAIYGKPLDIPNVYEELGDLEFFLERIRQMIGVSRDEIIGMNRQKLSVRYSSLSYTDEQAQARADKQ